MSSTNSVESPRGRRYLQEHFSEAAGNFLSFIKDSFSNIKAINELLDHIFQIIISQPLTEEDLRTIAQDDLDIPDYYLQLYLQLSEIAASILELRHGLPKKLSYSIKNLSLLILMQTWERDDVPKESKIKLEAEIQRHLAAYEQIGDLIPIEIEIRIVDMSNANSSFQGPFSVS